MLRNKNDKIEHIVNAYHIQNFHNAQTGKFQSRVRMNNIENLSKDWQTNYQKSIVSVKTNCYQFQYKLPGISGFRRMLFDTGAAINIIKFSKVTNIKQGKERKNFLRVIIDTLLISIPLFFANKNQIYSMSFSLIENGIIGFFSFKLPI